jgi:hypothetical protein
MRKRSIDIRADDSKPMVFVDAHLLTEGTLTQGASSIAGRRQGYFTNRKACHPMKEIPGMENGQVNIPGRWEKYAAVASGVMGGHVS